MNNSNILLLSRHSIPNIDLKTCYGQSDIDVKESFIKEVEKLYTKLIDYSITEIYSSPLMRCHKMAQFIQQKTESVLILDDRLKEMNFGNWEMENWADISRADLDVWATNPFGFKPPMGESFNDIILRSTEFYEEMKFKSSSLIVTHAGIIRAYLVTLLGMSPKDALNFELPFSCLCKLDLNKKTIQVI